MSLAQKQKFGADEYLAWEAEQIEKHEFVRGKVFAMVGARQSHVIVSVNLSAKLREHLRGTPCRPLVADMKLKIQAVDAFYYPDLMVTCDIADKIAEFYIEHPKLIIEILSDSTAAYDRGEKFSAYRKIESLEEYVLVDIDRSGVESFRRQADGTWLLHDFSGKENCLFESIDLTMPMALVFEDVEFS